MDCLFVYNIYTDMENLCVLQAREFNKSLLPGIFIKKILNY